MHKSWGNAIEFDEAAERMGVDVMRWMYASARPEDNILFGWHAADEARRELLILWNVYAFFVTYARLAGWTPGRRIAPPVAGAIAAGPLDPVACGRRRGRRRGPAARTTTRSRPRRGCSTPTSTTSRPGTCACRAGAILARCRRRPRRGASPRCTRPSSPLARTVAPILPFLSDVDLPEPRGGPDAGRPDSVHLTRWPDRRAGAATATSGSRRRWPIAQAGRRPGADAARHMPGSRSASRSHGSGWPCPDRDLARARRPAGADRATRSTSRPWSSIGDESELVERRRQGRSCPGSASGSARAIPAVMAAARDGAFDDRRRRVRHARRA